MTDQTKFLKYRIHSNTTIIRAFLRDTSLEADCIRQIGLESLTDAVDLYLFALGLEFPNLMLAYLARMSDGATPAKIFQLDSLTAFKRIS